MFRLVGVNRRGLIVILAAEQSWQISSDHTPLLCMEGKKSQLYVYIPMKNLFTVSTKQEKNVSPVV